MRHLDIEFEEIRLPIGSGYFQSTIRDYSPTNQVPVLKDDSLAIWDSMAIFEYLADKYPKHNMWPKDRAAKAYARSICAEMHAGFGPLRTQLPMNCRATDRQITPDHETLKDIARIQAIWRTCRLRWDHLGPWLMGQFSIVDAVFIPLASRFLTYNINLDESNQQWAAMILNSKAYKLWLAEATQETEMIIAYEIGIKPSTALA